MHGVVLSILGLQPRDVGNIALYQGGPSSVKDKGMGKTEESIAQCLLWLGIEVMNRILPSKFLRMS